ARGFLRAGGRALRGGLGPVAGFRRRGIQSRCRCPRDVTVVRDEDGPVVWMRLAAAPEEVAARDRHLEGTMDAVQHLPGQVGPDAQEVLAGRQRAVVQPAARLAVRRNVAEYGAGGLRGEVEKWRVVLEGEDGDPEVDRPEGLPPLGLVGENDVAVLAGGGAVDHLSVAFEARVDEPKLAGAVPVLPFSQAPRQVSLHLADVLLDHLGDRAHGPGASPAQQHAPVAEVADRG